MQINIAKKLIKLQTFRYLFFLSEETNHIKCENAYCEPIADACMLVKTNTILAF